LISGTGTSSLTTTATTVHLLGARTHPFTGTFTVNGSLDIDSAATLPATTIVHGTANDSVTLGLGVTLGPLTIDGSKTLTIGTAAGTGAGTGTGASTGTGTGSMVRRSRAARRSCSSTTMPTIQSTARSRRSRRAPCSRPHEARWRSAIAAAAATTSR
jgi:hypothetical protein